MAVHITPAFTGTITTDAGLRAAMQALSAGFDAVGFARTADTGQYDPATVTYAGLPASGETCFEIRVLNDTQSSNLPVYVKFYWYRGSSCYFGIRYGLATNGAGLLVGNSEYRVFQAVGSTVPAFITCGDGYVGFFTGSWSAGFYLNRLIDAYGQPGPAGFTSYSMAGSSRVETVDYSAITGVFTEPGAGYTLIPNSRTSSSKPGETLDVYRHWTCLTELQVNPFAVTVHHGEHSLGNTFTADPITGDVHTFMPFPTIKPAEAAEVTGCLAVRWE